VQGWLGLPLNRVLANFFCAARIPVEHPPQYLTSDCRNSVGICLKEKCVQDWQELQLAKKFSGNRLSRLL
jgi:hypothetical protein